ncbi:MAG: sucrose synthase, partial [Rivularia sp. (in: cyanobacteria)]
MSNLIQNVIDSREKSNLQEFANLLRQSEKRYLLHNDILKDFYKYCDINDHNKDLYRSSKLSKLIYSTQEIILDNESLYLVICPEIATQEAYHLLHDLTLEPIDIQELLNLRDKLVDFDRSYDEVLKIDFQSLLDSSPSLGDSKIIGNGVDYLNRYLSSKLFDDNCGTWQEAL